VEDITAGCAYAGADERTPGSSGNTAGSRSGAAAAPDQDRFIGA
jgi:hypothetical protein